MTAWLDAARDTAWPDIDDLGYEWYRELNDSYWEPPPPQPEPARCACSRVIVATVEETLECPGNWWWTGTAWAHVIGPTP